MEKWIAYVALVSLSFVVFLGKSYETSLRGIDSNIHAKISLNITSKGLSPRLPIPNTHPRSDVDSPPFNDHPFLMFWANGGVMRTLGPAAWSARLLTGFFSVGCVLLTSSIGTLLHSPLFGFLSAIFLLLTRGIILTGATVSLDPPLLFFILLSFLFACSGKWWKVGIATGIGLWIKTPVVLLVYPTFTFLKVLQGSLKKDFRKIGGSAVCALGIGSLVWILTGWIGGWDLVSDYWVRQLWGTAVRGRNLHGSDPWIFFRFVKNEFLPGLPFLVWGLFQIARKNFWRSQVVATSLVAIGVIAVVISSMNFRMDYYLNPTFPFLCFLSSFSLISFLKPLERKIYVGFSLLVLPLLALLLCAPISFGPEAFVELRKLMPFIQVYAKCSDTLLIVSGGELYGSAHDSSLVLEFYTGRKVEQVSCERVSQEIPKHSPLWLIISQENFNHCLTPADQALFKSRIQMNHHYLATSILLSTQTLNLTPLIQELKPSLDCVP